MDENTKQSQIMAESLDKKESKHYHLVSGSRKPFYNLTQEYLQKSKDVSLVSLLKKHNYNTAVLKKYNLL